MYEENKMMSMFSSHVFATISFESNLRKRFLDIRFTHRFIDIDEGIQSRNESYRFRILFSELKNIYQIGSKTKGSRTLLISLPHPPRFWRQLHDISRSHDQRSKSWSDWDSWYRQTDIQLDIRELSVQPLAIKKKKPTIDIGKTVSS